MFTSYSKTRVGKIPSPRREPALRHSTAPARGGKRPLPPQISSPQGELDRGDSPGTEGVNSLAPPTPKASVLSQGEYGGSLPVIDRENRAALGLPPRMKSTPAGDVRGAGRVKGLRAALAG